MADYVGPIPDLPKYVGSMLVASSIRGMFRGIEGEGGGGGMCGGEGESEGSDVKGRILNLNLDVYLHKILQVFTDILLLWIWQSLSRAIFSYKRHSDINISLN